MLQEIKNDDDLRSIPVVVLTTSEVDEDILRSYPFRRQCSDRQYGGEAGPPAERDRGKSDRPRVIGVRRSACPDNRT